MVLEKYLVDKVPSKNAKFGANKNILRTFQGKSNNFSTHIASVRHLHLPVGILLEICGRLSENCNLLTSLLFSTHNVNLSHISLLLALIHLGPPSITQH